MTVGVPGLAAFSSRPLRRTLRGKHVRVHYGRAVRRGGEDVCGGVHYGRAGRGESDGGSEGVKIRPADTTHSNHALFASSKHGAYIWEGSTTD